MCALNSVALGVVLFVALAPVSAQAQAPAGPQQAAGPQDGRPPIKLFRYEEDWRPLADPAIRTEPLDRLKFLPVSDDGWLTIGGEQRLRYEAYDHPRFGFAGPGGSPPAPRDSYLLSRTLLHADLHVTPSFRAFVQVGAYSVHGEEVGPAPLNDNEFDLAQAFIEATPVLGDVPVLIRAGRQEMGFGSQRLISIREGPNTRLAFDGIRIGATVGKVRIDGFATRPVSPDFGSVDDSSSERSSFYGVYATVPIEAVPGLRADLYYLDLTRPGLRFAQVAGDEHRYTIGTRLFGAAGNWDWDLEAAYQFGTLGSADISAWTIANEIGYRWTDVAWSPRIFLRADIASGDTDLADDTLGTFEAPFPKIPYLTEAGNLLAPQNLMDLHPGVSVRPRQNLTLSAEYAAVWKHRTADAFYLPPGVPVAATQGGSRFATQLVQLSANWSITPQLTLSGGYVHAFAERAIRESGGRDSDFVLLNASAKF